MSYLIHLVIIVTSDNMYMAISPILPFGFCYGSVTFYNWALKNLLLIKKSLIKKRLDPNLNPLYTCIYVKVEINKFLVEKNLGIIS